MGGPAGGARAGNYPNPGLASGAVTDSALSTSMASVPIAGGTVYWDGTNANMVAGFDRLGGTPSVTREGTGDYDISIPGVNYVWWKQITQVTPVGGLHQASIAGYGGDLIVSTFSGTTPLDGSFSFLVYN